MQPGDGYQLTSAKKKKTRPKNDSIADCFVVPVYFVLVMDLTYFDKPEESIYAS